MTLAPYQGHFLTPGLQAELYSVESDIASLIYGPLHQCLFLNWAVIDGSARDAGNVGNTTVLRQGLVLGQVTTTKKWKQWDPDAVDGTEIARGILAYYGVNTQYGGGDADRYLASILVKGNVQAKSVCLEDTDAAGLPQTGDGLTVRQHLLYNVTFDDDFIAALSRPTPL